MRQLYSYWRSTAAYRVRIALNLKGLEYETVAVHMLKDGGEQHKAEYRAINPQGLVPTLVDDDITLTQSIAIMEYLEEKYPEPALLPENIYEKAFARQLAHSIASDIHPLNNLRVLMYLKNELNVDEDSKNTWYHHWIRNGFEAIEKQLAQRKNIQPYCLGEQITLADICLVPQFYNAHRFNVNVDDYPILNAIEKACLQHEAFINASPEQQPDADS